jgi:hypothetical protein
MTHTVPTSCIPTPNSMDLGALITLTADGAGTVNSATQENFGDHGVTIGVNITAVGGTPTLNVNIYGLDGVSNQKYLLLGSVALTAVGFTQLTVYPGIVPAANVAANSVLPSKWFVQTVVAGTTPAVTATIGASAIF